MSICFFLQFIEAFGAYASSFGVCEKSHGFLCEDQVEAGGRPIYWGSRPFRVRPELWGLRGEPASLQERRTTSRNFLEEFYKPNMDLQECLPLQAVLGKGPKRSLASKKTQSGHCEGHREKTYFEQHQEERRRVCRQTR